jgi:hypothetical protein
MLRHDIHAKGDASFGTVARVTRQFIPPGDPCSAETWQLAGDELPGWPRTIHASVTRGLVNLASHFIRSAPVIMNPNPCL